MSVTKTCRRCDQPLPATSFPANRRLNDGLSSWCRDCHRAAVRASRAAHGDRYNAERRVKPISIATCKRCGNTFAKLATSPSEYCSESCRHVASRERGNARHRGRYNSDPAYRAASDAHARHQRHRRRVQLHRTDVNAAYVARLLATTKTCSLCRVRLRNEPGPRQKQIDHIIPIVAGGTHTHGNLRVICRTCNLTRPRDGSDYTGPLTLWQIASRGASESREAAAK
jgi:hypothetical protein